MSATEQIFSDQQVPPPSHYTPKHQAIQHQAPQFSLSSRHKMLQAYQNQVSAASYDPNLSQINKQAPSFSLSSRDNTKQYIQQSKITVPGPGQYTVFPAHGKALNTAPSFSLSGKFTTKTDNIPAPNNYNPKQIIRQTEQYTMKSKHGEIYDGKSTSGIISGGDYNPEKQKVSSTAPQYSMRSKHTVQQEHCSPGPQKYNQQQSSIKKNGGSTMSSRYSRGWRIF